MRITRIKLSLFALIVMALVVSAVPAANATTYNLTSAGTLAAGTYGTVTVTQVGANVSVVVTLNAGDGFVSTGAGGNNSFLWDMNNKGPLTLTGLTSGFTSTLTNQNDGIHADGSGNWDFAVNCAGGGACGTGGSSPFTGTLSFTINNVLLSDFTNSSSGFLFAADICVGTPGCSGGTGMVVAQTPTTPVPEPGTLGLLGTGLVGLAGLLRRRFLS